MEGADEPNGLYTPSGLGDDAKILLFPQKQTQTLETDVISVCEDDGHIHGVPCPDILD
jgi:hypothetical protein